VPIDAEAIATPAIDSEPVGGCDQTGATSWCSRQRPALGAWLVDVLTELQDLRAATR
jgi:hypothetical protein